jgi:hypothetical protein
MSESSILLYTAEDGRIRIDCRFEEETIWLSQKLISELFDRDVRTINEHLNSIFSDGELDQNSVIRKFRITAGDGKTYEVQHYNLDAIIAVGYRVRSPQGTQFRQWATARLREFLVKGFTMDDNRLMNPPGPGVPDYFDELLARIRAIRASERRFYQKVLYIFATSIDYAPNPSLLRCRVSGWSYSFRTVFHGAKHRVWLLKCNIPAETPSESLSLQLCQQPALDI